MNSTIEKSQQQTTAISQAVTTTVQNYLDECGDKSPSNLYELFLELCEEPLFKLLMERTRGNQCEVTRILGLARGTVRKKLKQYGFLTTKPKKSDK